MGDSILRGFLKKVTEAADIPPDIALGAPKITVTGSDSLRIEGHSGIVEYSDDRIVINCKAFLADIKGSALSIEAMSSFELLISGMIAGIELIYREAE